MEQACGKIQQTCAYEPANYFGVGASNMQERCAYYASGVVKLMSKDEIDYYANYGLIPTLSKDKYDEVKKRCAVGTTTPAPGDKPQKKSGSHLAYDFFRKPVPTFRDHAPGSICGETSARSASPSTPAITTRSPSIVSLPSASNRSASG